jgi:Protein of unknown function (DUF2510)
VTALPDQSDSSGHPEGWYRDPWNEILIRYWDGRAWTGYTANALLGTVRGQIVAAYAKPSGGWASGYLIARLATVAVLVDAAFAGFVTWERSDAVLVAEPEGDDPRVRAAAALRSWGGRKSVYDLMELPEMPALQWTCRELHDAGLLTTVDGRTKLGKQVKKWAAEPESQAFVRRRLHATMSGADRSPDAIAAALLVRYGDLRLFQSLRPYDQLPKVVEAYLSAAQPRLGPAGWIIDSYRHWDWTKRD